MTKMHKLKEYVRRRQTKYEEKQKYEIIKELTVAKYEESNNTKDSFSTKHFELV